MESHAENHQNESDDSETIAGEDDSELAEGSLDAVNPEDEPSNSLDHNNENNNRNNASDDSEDATVIECTEDTLDEKIEKQKKDGKGDAEGNNDNHDLSPSTLHARVRPRLLQVLYLCPRG